MILLNITGQKLFVNGSHIVDGSRDYITGRAKFSGDWSGMTKYAHFRHGEDEPFSIQLDDDGWGKDAHVNLTTGKWAIWIHGTDGTTTVTTDIVTVDVKPTGAIDGNPFPELKPNIVELQVEQAKEYSISAEVSNMNAQMAQTAAERARDAAIAAAEDIESTGYFLVTEGETTIAEAKEAYEAGKLIVGKLEDGTYVSLKSFRNESFTFWTMVGSELREYHMDDPPYGWSDSFIEFVDAELIDELRDSIKNSYAKHGKITAATDLNSLEMGTYEVWNVNNPGLPEENSYGALLQLEGDAKPQIYIGSPQSGNSPKIYVRRYLKNDKKFTDWTEAGSAQDTKIMLYEREPVRDVTAENTGRVFKIVSYNVSRWLNDTGTVYISDERLNNLKQFLNTVDADFICTQEDYRYIDGNSQIPETYVFGNKYPFRYKDEGASSYNAIGIYSKYPAISNETVVLADVNKKIRVCKFRVPDMNKVLAVVDYHATYSGDHESTVKIMEYRSVFNYLYNTDGNWDYLVVCGDFNSKFDEDKAELKALAETYGFVLGNGGDLGWFKSNRSGTQIDNIILSANCIFEDIRSCESWYDKLWSDHIPLLGTFRLTDSNPPAIIEVTADTPLSEIQYWYSKGYRVEFCPNASEHYYCDYCTANDAYFTRHTINGIKYYHVTKSGFVGVTTKAFADQTSVAALSAEIATQAQLMPEATPTVGKVLKVLSVNEDGTFTCEWADGGSGGLAGVKVGNKSSVVDVSDNVANIKLGIGVNTSADNLAVTFAGDSDIKNRYTGYAAVSPRNMDAFVRTALGDGKGAPWESDEQAAACERLGAVYDGEFQLINSIDFDYATATAVTLASRDDGTPFDLGRIRILIEVSTGVVVGNYGQIFCKDANAVRILTFELGNLTASSYMWASAFYDISAAQCSGYTRFATVGSGNNTMYFRFPYGDINVNSGIWASKQKIASIEFPPLTGTGKIRIYEKR